MESLAPRAAFQVDNTLTEEGGRMSIDLTLNQWKILDQNSRTAG
jgi:predicted component of type VI protein secretion system